MKQIKIIVSISLVFMSVACASKTNPKASGGANYEEDLEPYRPKYELKETPKATASVGSTKNIQFKDHNNIEVEEKLGLIREKNKSIKYTQGYRIQVYSGSNQEAAEKAKEGIYRLDPNFDPEVIYFPPNFKVKVGNYYDRIEAYETLLKIRESFPQALLLPERVTIK